MDKNRKIGRRYSAEEKAAAEINRLELELRELKRANEILKRAASFFGAELDRRHQ